MSSIYRFRITQLAGNELEVRTAIVHPDETTIHATKNFALQIIIDLFFKLVKGYTYDLPMNDEEAAALVAASPMKEQLLHWMELWHGKTVEISEQEYNNIWKLRDAGEPKFQGVTSSGASAGRYEMTYETEYAAFAEAAEEQIVSVELKDTVHYPRDIDRMSWEERGQLSDEEVEAHYARIPEGTLVIRVRNADLLFHLRSRMRWESAIYDFTHYV